MRDHWRINRLHDGQRERDREGQCRVGDEGADDSAKQLVPPERQSLGPEQFRMSELFDRLTRTLWGEVGGAPAGMKALEGPSTRREPGLVTRTQDCSA